MKKLAIALFCLLALTIAAEAQKKTKPWTEWSEKEVTKMLNDSPWGQTQTSTDTSQMTFSPATPRNLPSRPLESADPSGSQGALNQAVNLNFRIRLLSAKPIRQAFARQVMLKNPQLADQLKQFAEQTSNDWIVVAVDFDSADRRFSGPAMQAFNSANPAQLKTNTYLETKDGKRVFLDKYMQPSNDGMGAKFIFPRIVNGEPFVAADGGFIRFYSELTSTIKLNMRFKIPDMTYNDKLEF